jgi:hypothetical protein
MARILCQSANIVAAFSSGSIIAQHPLKNKFGR